MGPPTTICSVMCRKRVGNSSPLLTQHKSTWVKHHMGLLSILLQVLHSLMIFGFLPKILKWEIFVAALINVCMLGPQKLSGLCHNPIPWLYPDFLAQFSMNLSMTITSCYYWLLFGAWACSAPGSVLQSWPDPTMVFQDAILAWGTRIALTFKMKI